MIEAVAGRHKRLIIEMPPRHGKSETLSHYTPVWVLEHFPHWPIILTSYEADFAMSWGRKVRDTIIANQDLLTVRISQSSGAANRWNTTQGGGMISAGVGGPITGRGAKLFIVDDPVKNMEEARSASTRQKIKEWFSSTAYTRLEPDGIMIIIMTRWHHDDLVGWLLAEGMMGGETYHRVRLPALAETQAERDLAAERMGFETGQLDPLNRQPGEALWPKMWPQENLLRTKQAVGSYVWNSLYQQTPTPEGGLIFKREWFDIVDSYPKGLTWYRYWDLATTTNRKSSYTASAAIALDPRSADLYIRDMVRGRWEWPEARKVLINTMRLEPRTFHIVERAGPGTSLFQDLKRMSELSSINFSSMVVEKDKVTRALPWAARAELGKVKLVKGPWVNPFFDEITQFDLGEFDDQVDSVSGGWQAIQEQKQKGFVSW